MTAIPLAPAVIAVAVVANTIAAAATLAPRRPVCLMSLFMSKSVHDSLFMSTGQIWQGRV